MNKFRVIVANNKVNSSDQICYGYLKEMGIEDEFFDFTSSVRMISFYNEEEKFHFTLLVLFSSIDTSKRLELLELIESDPDVPDYIKSKVRLSIAIGNIKDVVT